jgi:holliday junction DNA helicase RuvB
MKIFGQEKTLKQLELILPSLKKPIIILGPSGYGKTHIAKYIARKTGRIYKEINCAFISHRNMFINSLISAESNDMFFLDEIHALNRDMQEILYSVIDNREIIIENAPIRLNNFLLVAATTNEGDLNEPLFNRFVYDLRLDDYSIEELAMIISSYSQEVYSINIDPDAAIELAVMSRGCPRIAKKRVDWAAKYGVTVCTEIVNDLRTLLEIDEHGFEKKDLDYMKFIIKGRNKPVSLKSLCQKLKMDEKSVIDHIETFLIQRNLLQKDSRGRSINMVEFQRLYGRK